MRSSIALFVVAALASQPILVCAQESSAPDTRVYLADGTVVMGRLLERREDLVILRGSDGEIFTFEPGQIDKLVTLDSLGSQAQTVTVHEFPYISFLGGTVALGLVSWLQFDTASNRDTEAKINESSGLLPRARALRDRADRARLWGWSSAALAVGSLGVALIPRTKTKKVFPEMSVDAGGQLRLQLVYRQPL